MRGGEENENIVTLNNFFPMSQEQGKQSYGIIKPNRETHTHTQRINCGIFCWRFVRQPGRHSGDNIKQFSDMATINIHPSIQPNFIKYKNSQSSCSIPTPCMHVVVYVRMCRTVFTCSIDSPVSMWEHRTTPCHWNMWFFYYLCAAMEYKQT